MIFRTKLDELTTRNTAGSPRAHPPKDRRLVPIKLSIDSPFAGTILSLTPSSCALLRYSFTIYSFSHMEQQPNFDGVHVLSTDRSSYPTHPTHSSSDWGSS